MHPTLASLSSFCPGEVVWVMYPVHWPLVLPSFPGPRVAWETKPCPMTASSFSSLHQEMWQVTSCLRKTYQEEWKLCRWECRPLINSAALCQLSPRKLCCLIPLLCALGFCWLRCPKPNLLLFGSILRLGSWIFEQSWCFQTCPGLIVRDGDPVHELWETSLIKRVLFQWDLYSLLHSYCFWVKAIYYRVVCPLHCYSLNIICVTLFGSSGSDVFTIHGSTSGCVSVWDDGYVRVLWQLYLYNYSSDLCQQKILYSAGSFPSSKAILNPPWQLPCELLVILIAFH